MGGIGAAQFLDDLGLGQTVDLGRKVHALLFNDVEALDAIHVTQDHVTSGARGAYRDVDGGSGHGFGLAKERVSGRGF
jgi:hypothetical protein